MYGLIGYPLGHSFSKEYFSRKFMELGINEEYELFPISSINQIGELMNSAELDIEGLNVTIPYKEKIIEHLSDIDSDALCIGAVNVVKVVRNKGIPSLIGFNTDWKGFLLSLSPLLENRHDITDALILGTGGAAKAVAFALSKLGIKFKLVSRNPKKGDLTYSMLDKAILSHHLLVINTTPLGTFPDISSCPDIPYNHLTPNHICFDLVYNPSVTEFMKRSEDNGAKVKNGLEMLYNQADLAWQIWNA